MGRPLNSHYDAIIVGAGLSGLSSAYRLANNGRRVLLIDAADHVGGVIQSVSLAGEWLIERGPNSYTSFGQVEDSLLTEIGLRDRVQRRLMKTAERFVWHSGKLHSVPMGALQLLTSDILPFAAKIAMGKGAMGRYEPPTEDVSLGHWLRNTLGDEMVETLLKPFFGGIYAADVDKASFAVCAKAIYDRVCRTDRLVKVPFVKVSGGKKKSGGGKPAPKSLTSYPNGLKELPEALAAATEKAGGEILLGQRVGLERTGGVLNVIGADWACTADHLILATPASATATLLKAIAPKTAETLAKIPSVGLNVLHLGLKRADLKELRDGFGFLTRRQEGVRILGSIWSSRMFPGRAPEGHDLLTCFYGGDLDPEAMEMDDAQLREEAMKDLRKTMGWSGKDFDLFEVTRWRPALPLLRVGHDRLIEEIRNDLPSDVHLVSSYLGKPAAPDRIRTGFAMAEELLSVKAGQPPHSSHEVAAIP